MVRVSAGALDFALAHVERYGDTDILPRAFEFKAIRSSWEAVRQFLAGQDLDTWSVGPLRRSLSPKGRLGYRIVTQLDPLDTLLLTALVYEMGADIEQARIPRGDDIVLSNRFQPDASGILYAKTYSYDKFRRRSLTMASQYPDGWVVLADIADFYPRLYTHRLENALEQATTADYARVISKLIRAWNQHVSYGVPIGPAATGLLAELAISDIDSLLLANQVVYCRYSDDFRIFATTEAQALANLAFLANCLYKNHGLTLQGAKTELMPAAKFVDHFRETDEQRVKSTLKEGFLDILNHHGIDTYGTFEYEDLTPEARTIVDNLNLYGIVVDQVTRDQRIDVPLLGFALRRLSQVGGVSVELGRLLLLNIDKLIPVYRDIITAFAQIKVTEPSNFRNLIPDIVSLLDHPYLSHLGYYRSWTLTLFQDRDAAEDGQWQMLYTKYSNSHTRRKLILTIGAANEHAWIRMNKDTIHNLGAWERRAFLAAAGCLPKDEAKHWFGAVDRHMERLDRWIITWVKNEHIKSRVP